MLGFIYVYRLSVFILVVLILIFISGHCYRICVFLPHIFIVSFQKMKMETDEVKFT